MKSTNANLINDNLLLITKKNNSLLRLFFLVRNLQLNVVLFWNENKQTKDQNILDNKIIFFNLFSKKILPLYKKIKINYAKYIFMLRLIRIYFFSK